MTKDLENWERFILSLSESLSLMKEARDLISDESTRGQVTELLERAENEFNLSKAKAAVQFGYPLCRCTFPPQVMLLKDGKYLFHCPGCGRSVDLTPQPSKVISRGPNRWLKDRW